MKAQALLVAVAFVAAGIPWLGKPRPAISASAFPGWEQAPLPDEVKPLKLGQREERFARDFPGRIAAFSAGETVWIARWIDRPTRKLHPAADCFRAAGFTVTPGPAWNDSTGVLWGAFAARLEAQHLRVRERILDGAGRSWTDVSAWYWAALLGRTEGPWWAVTRVDRAAAVDTGG